MKKVFTIVFLVVLTAAFYAQSFQWTYQNPLPQGADLNDVLITGTGEVMAFGNAGIVMRSSNGAESWSMKYIDTLSRDINKACFVNGNVGYLVGNSGLIMKTTNAGESWTYLNSGSTSNLTDVAFYDADSGYVVGASGTILKTTNGGLSWKASAVGTSTHNAVCILNPGLVYIGSILSTSRLMVSTDYGKTWQNATPAAITATVYAVKFLSSTTGFLSTGNGIIFKTIDAGKTWTKKATVSSGNIQDFSFVTPTEIICVDTKGYISKSNDAGETWTPANVTNQKLYGSVSDLSASYAVGSAGTIYKSNMAVTEWTSKTKFATQQQLRQITFLDNQNGLACGGSVTAADSLGQLVKTTDGGLSWNVLPYNFKSVVYGFACPAVNVWFVATGTKVFKTVDGGNTFTLLNLPITGTSQVIWGISFWNESIGYIVGTKGTMYKTVDGGASWTPVVTSFSTTETISDVQAFSADKVMIVGWAGKVYKSVNGGSTWTQQVSNVAGNIFCMRFKDENNGYIAGNTQGLARTTDGGLTWEPQSVPSQLASTASFWGIGIADSAVWVSSGNGDVIYSRNKGPWTLAPKFTTSSLFDIAVVGNNIYVTGINGIIVKGSSDPYLPVELTSFSAEMQGTSAVLSWKTATETNNRGFDVEKKTAGSSWQKIGFVKGAGTSTAVHSYSFTDKQPGSGTILYRLKQIDYDGTIKYYSAAEVNNAAAYKFSLSQNYPNPFNPSTNISYTVPATGKVSLKIFNILGREVATVVNGIQQAGEYKIIFNASELASGIYFYELRCGNYTATRKMTLLK